MTGEDALTARAAAHHRTFIRVDDVRVVARPLPSSGWWRRRREERACLLAIGHCWHAMHGILADWWCCECSAGTNGQPPQECRICLQSTTSGNEGGRLVLV